MSIETPSWKTGAAQASVSRRAIVLRVGVSVTTSTSPARLGSGSRGRGAPATRSRLDVLGDDPAVRPGAGERGEVDAALARDPARERRRLDPPAAGPGGRRRCGGDRGAARRCARLGRSAGRGRSAPGSDRTIWRRCVSSTRRRSITAIVVADLDLALLDDDLEEDAVEVRLDLLRHLVGVELVERLVLLDRVALRLQPADDRAGLHPLPEPRQLDLGRHQRTPARRSGGTASGSLATVVIDAIMLTRDEARRSVARNRGRPARRAGRRSG